MEANAPVRGRGFWGWMIVIAVAADLALVLVLSFTSPAFFIGGVGQCVDVGQESRLQSTCTESTYVGPGVWMLLAAGAVVVAYLVYRLVRSGRRPD